MVIDYHAPTTPVDDHGTTLSGSIGLTAVDLRWIYLPTCWHSVILNPTFSYFLVRIKDQLKKKNDCLQKRVKFLNFPVIPEAEDSVGSLLNPRNFVHVCRREFQQSFRIPKKFPWNLSPIRMLHEAHVFAWRARPRETRIVFARDRRVGTLFSVRCARLIEQVDPTLDRAHGACRRWSENYRPGQSFVCRWSKWERFKSHTCTTWDEKETRRELRGAVGAKERVGEKEWITSVGWRGTSIEQHLQ